MNRTSGRSRAACLKKRVCLPRRAGNISLPHFAAFSRKPARGSNAAVGGKLQRKNAMPDILPILKEPNPILREQAREIPLEDISSARIQRLIRGMKETLSATSDGVGLAAPQVGESLRLFIVSEEAREIDRMKRRTPDAPDPAQKEKTPAKKQWAHYVFINPKLKNISRRSREDTEGCLSVPEIYGRVARREKLTVEAYDERGEKFARGASNFFARVVQHELDHLHGILFKDTATGLVRIERPAPAQKS